MSQHKIKHSANINEQLALLKSRGLIIDNPFLASEVLSSIGYYNVINAYKQPFLVNKSSETFITGTTFSDVYNIYEFDKRERRILQTVLEEVEQQLRQISSRKFIEEYGDDPEKYQDMTTYRSFKNPSSFKKFKSKIEYPALHDNSQPYKHYRDNYKGVPLWVAMTDWDFGTLETFIRHLDIKVKTEIINEFFADVFLETMRSDTVGIDSFFSELLVLIRNFRNRVSHGYRVYNYRPISIDKSGKHHPIIQYYVHFHGALGITRSQYKKGTSNGDIIILLNALRKLRYVNPAIRLQNETLDNLTRALHDHQNIDFFLTRSLGYSSDAIAAFVRQQISRNKTLKVVNSQISDIYNYYFIDFAPDLILVNENDLPSTMVNMHHY